MKTLQYILLNAIFLLPVHLQAADMPDFISDCTSCHALEQPETASLADRISRKAPPLFYAGNKFRVEWLVAWLQDPVRLRPAGDYPPAHSRTVGDKDEIVTASLLDHPVLTQEQAQLAASWLMMQTPYEALIAAEAGYTPGNVSARMGAMDFVKFKGCGGCHQDDPEYGGFSGPELYTAWKRLQPAYISSYIRNPLPWEPYSLMPNKELQDSHIYKLANYLKVIAEQGE